MIQSGLIRDTHPSSFTHLIDEYTKWADTQNHAHDETIGS